MLNQLWINNAIILSLFLYLHKILNKQSINIINTFLLWYDLSPSTELKNRKLSHSGGGGTVSHVNNSSRYKGSSSALQPVRKTWKYRLTQHQILCLLQWIFYSIFSLWLSCFGRCHHEASVASCWALIETSECCHMIVLS